MLTANQIVALDTRIEQRESYLDYVFDKIQQGSTNFAVYKHTIAQTLKLYIQNKIEKCFENEINNELQNKVNLWKQNISNSLLHNNPITIIRVYEEVKAI